MHCIKSKISEAIEMATRVIILDKDFVKCLFTTEHQNTMRMKIKQMNSLFHLMNTNIDVYL